MSNRSRWVAAACGMALIAWGLWSALGGAPQRAAVAPEPAGTSTPGVDPTRGALAPVPDAPDVANVPAAPEVPDESVSAAAAPVEGTSAWLVVRVIAEGTGAPIEGVGVSATAIRETPGEPRVLETTDTDAEGRVELEVEPGVRHDVFARDRRSGRDEPVGSASLEVEPGVRHDVFVRDRRSGRDEPVGSASLEVEPLLAGERREVTVEVPFGRDLVFFARVVDGSSDAPIPGARAVGERARDSVEADASGLLELRVPSWNPGAFALSADGYGLRRFIPAAGHERVDAARTLTLLPVATLKVTVRDEGTQPLDTLSVRLSAKGYELDMPDEQVHLGVLTFGGNDRSWTERCAPDGTCALTDLPAQVPFDVELLRAGKVLLRPGSFGLEPGEVREVEWRLNSGVRVVGEVRDQDGAPVARCALGCFPASVGPNTAVDRWRVPEHMFDKAHGLTASDADGRFAFEDVAPGTWWIGPRPDEGDARAVAPVAQRVEVPAGVHEHVVDLRFERGLYIRGSVITPDGSVPKYAWLSAGTEAVGGGAFGQMQDDGSFALGPLAAGSYRLQARTRQDYAPSREVVASAGDQGVVLQLQQAGALAGQVVDARDGAGRHASLSLAAAGEAWGNMSTSTKADGSFELGGLGEGTYHLAATSADGLVAVLGDLVVTPGATSDGLRLELRPGARVEVRYKGAAEYCQFRVKREGALLGNDGLKTGGAAVVFVPPGPIEVVFSLSGQTVETRRAELGVGDEHSFLFAPGDR